MVMNFYDTSNGTLLHNHWFVSHHSSNFPISLQILIHHVSQMFLKYADI